MSSINGKSGNVRTIIQCRKWALKLKTLTFDCKPSWGMYRVQFETAAQINNWNDAHKETQLVLALHRSALELLQTIPSANQRVDRNVRNSLW